MSRLQKVLAQAGLGSRREIESWIKAGRIQINHSIAKLGDKVDEKTLIEVDGRPLENTFSTQVLPAVLIYHKPVGELCTRHDPEGRPTVFDSLPKLPHGRWIIVGRLDYNTSGLLLFTNNGELANRLMHPSSHLKRAYTVRIYGSVTNKLLARLKHGVLLDDGPAHFDAIESIGGDGRNHWYKVTISIGKNRIVRRLWESQNVKVNRLIRIEFGPLTLPQSLKAGKYTLLSAHDVENLQQKLEC